MGVIQNDTYRITMVSYLGLLLGYFNKAVLFIWVLQLDEIGLVNLLGAVGLLFSRAANFGLINTSIRFYPFFGRENSNVFLGFILRWLLIGILVAVLAVIAFRSGIVEFYSQKSPDFVEYYYYIIPIGIGNVVYFLFEAHLKGLFKNFIPVLAYEVILRLLITGLLLLLWFDLLNFESFLVGHALVYFAPAIILLFYLIYLKQLPKFRIKGLISRRLRKIMVFYSGYNYLNTLGATAVITMDALMLAAFMNLEKTGVYTTLIYIISALQIPYRSLLRVATPFIPVYWKRREMDNMSELYKGTSSLSLFIGLFLFVAIWSVRDTLFGLFPEEFHEASLVFLALIIGRLIDQFFGLNGTILYNSKKYRVDILFTGILLLLVFVLNYVLIPIYGLVGAAISTTIAVGTYNIMRMLYVWYHFKLHPFRLSQLWTFLFFCLALVATWFARGVFDASLIQDILKNGVIILITFLIPMILLRVEPALNDFLVKQMKFLKRS